MHDSVWQVSMCAVGLGGLKKCGVQAHERTVLLQAG